MYYIRSVPNPSGAYGAPMRKPFPGCVAITDEQTETLLAYNGFVTVTQTENGCTVTPDVDAWNAWKAEQTTEPEEPEPPETLTVEERLTTLEDELQAAKILLGVSE